MLAVVVAGFAAGGINTIVGSGSLVTFPTLLAVGYPPVLANVTNTVGITAGSISGMIGYRRELAGQLRRCLVFGSATTLGAILGGVLLLLLPGSVFEAVVPVLILLACVLIAAHPWISKRIANVQARHLGVAGWIGVFLTGVYGGYFGAAQGVILIALLSLVVNDHLQRINGLKNVLGGIANLVSALLFVIVTDVAWGAAALVALGAVLGGQVGAHYGRRIPQQVLRWTIVTVGTGVAIFLMLT